MSSAAPPLAVATSAPPRRTTLVAFQAVFVAAHVVGALAPATPCSSRDPDPRRPRVRAGFWGVAVATAVALVPADAKSRARSALVAWRLTPPRSSASPPEPS
ncbi:hypothetical protein [Streptomyces sp. KL116D]|uniref:hypothetical protein n=1 Tax=Streptomyces sp. KL116D TaxID=3045152 RepID=UPI003558A3C5